MILHYMLLLLIVISPARSLQVGNFNDRVISSNLFYGHSMEQLQTGPRTRMQSTTRMPRKASETSSDFGDIISSKAGSVCNVLAQNFQSLGQSFPFLASAPSAKMFDVLRKSWWMTPMLLAVVPLYCAFAQGACAAMPDWWKVVNMEYIKQSKDAALVVGCFLSSNIAYFASGAYLLRRFPFENSGTKGVLKPTRFSMLGIWILVSGLISTIFHSVQAVGPHALAEALCYIDHAFAISSGAYFLETCGRPSPRVLSIGMVSLVTLAVTSPGYVWLHSTWHFLSAATATRWAIEGHARVLGKR
jgi:hypothetical protein